MIGVFFGCTTRSNEYLDANLNNLLKKIKISFFPLGRELCCGAPFHLAGTEHDFKEQAKKVKEEIEKQKLNLIITTCPHCFTTLKYEYPKIGIQLEKEVLHITQFIKKMIDEGNLIFQKKSNKKILYHDPCYIGRQSEGIFDEPREILRKAGYEIVEFDLNRDNSICCGGGGLLRAYLPKLSVEVSKEKLITYGKEADFVTAPCPFCYQNLKEGAEGLNYVVKDFIEILLEAL